MCIYICKKIEALSFCVGLELYSLPLLMRWDGILYFIIMMGKFISLFIIKKKLKKKKRRRKKCKNRTILWRKKTCYPVLFPFSHFQAISPNISAIMCWFLTSFHTFQSKFIVYQVWYFRIALNSTVFKRLLTH